METPTGCPQGHPQGTHREIHGDTHRDTQGSTHGDTKSHQPSLPCPSPRPLSPPVLFLLVLILLFGLMIWLTLYPLGFPKSLLKLKHIEDFNFKLLLLGIAALNFFAAFVLEVGQGGLWDGASPWSFPRGHGALLSSPNPVSLPFWPQTALDHGLLSCFRRLRRKKASKKLFKRLEKELSQQQPAWPPLDQPLFATPRMSLAVR